MSKFDKLQEIVKKLRAPDGCDWDKEQTHESLTPYLLEEVYEVIEAIENKDFNLLKEELGDLLLHVIFQADLAEENNKFNIQDSLDSINNKLISRHPHIFKSKNDQSWGIGNWELQKHKEKIRNSRLDGVPKSLPGLIQAQRIQEKASYVGFDFEKEEDIWDKLLEEITELKNAQKKNNKDEVQEEIGDIIFTLINLARFLGISADDALRKSNNKFISRFKMVENELKIKGKNIEEFSINEMNEIWDEIKTNNN